MSSDSNEKNIKNLLNAFKNSIYDDEIAFKATEEFKNIKDKQPYILPIKNFIDKQQCDAVKSWAAYALGLIKDEKSFDMLVDLMNNTQNDHDRSIYELTRFWTLNGIAKNAVSEKEKKTLINIIKEIFDNPKDENYLTLAEDSLLLMKYENTDKGEELLKEMFKGNRFSNSSSNQDSNTVHYTYGPIEGALRALREFPCSDFIKDITSVTGYQIPPIMNKDFLLYGH